MSSEIKKMPDGNYQKELKPNRAPKHCDECGEVPWGENLYNFCGDWLCEDCLLAKFPVINVWE